MTLLDRLLDLAANSPDAAAFEHFSNGEVVDSLSFSELQQFAAGTAYQLRDRGFAGQPVLLLHEFGLQFLIDLFGCFMIGAIAVPAPAPNTPQGAVRLAKIAEQLDARGALVGSINGFLSLGAPQMEGLEAIATERLKLSEIDLSPASAALVQFTSGSTREPKGALLTHEQIAANLAAIEVAFEIRPKERAERTALWLPQFHDMGLFARLQSIWSGYVGGLISPAEFVRRPASWLNLISDTDATIAGGPNFAFDLCSEGTLRGLAADLDLSTWRVAFCGAEPVRSRSLRRFAAKFRGQGLRQQALTPCYGMAEATLIVTCKSPGVEFQERLLDVDALETDRTVVGTDKAARSVVSVGPPCLGFDIRVADSVTGDIVGEDYVGEILVNGPSVFSGYLTGRGLEVDASWRDIGGEKFFPTGDLGFMSGGELFVTGRRKAQIIIRGRNLQAEDLEAAAADTNAMLSPGMVAAFEARPGEGESLTVVAEFRRANADTTPENLAHGILRRISHEFGVIPEAVVIVAARNVQKTSSGKVARENTRRSLEGGAMKVVFRLTADHLTSQHHASPVQGDVEGLVRNILAQELGVPADQVDTTAEFASMGLDSMGLLRAAQRLEEATGREVGPETLFENPTPARLCSWLRSSAGAQSETVLQAAARGGVAITGMACRFPGAQNLQAFWRLLSDGRHAISHRPLARNLDAANEPGLAGGYLDQAEWFDASFFRITPNEALRMDPQQRMLLEVAYEAFLDAGLSMEELSRARVGVFVGISANEYGARGLIAGPQDATSATGAALSIAANRISYIFDLKGPSLAVDTACSSSLVALDQARGALERGDCDIALVAGANLLVSDAVDASFKDAGVLAPDGLCKAFADDADGYGRGEGVGAVVLRHGPTARAVGDRVYAWLEATAVNQDGRTNGLMAPNGAAQRDVIRLALARAGIRPAELRFVEAHGTGTALGDLVEAKALGTVVSEDRHEPCLVGSVKTNIGHLEAAAGIAGLIKSVLALHHRLLPASLHCVEPNKRVDFGALNLRVPTTAEFLEGDRPILAGVSSFGFGGTNAHAILRSADQNALRNEAGTPSLFLSSRFSHEGLRARLRWYRETVTDKTIGAAAAASQRRISHANSRMALLGESGSDLLRTLAAELAQEASPNVIRGEVLPADRQGIVYVFPGQGKRFWPLPKSVTECSEFLAPLRGQTDKLANFLGADWLERLSTCEAESLTGDAIRDQVALVAVQMGLASVCTAWGRQPAGVIGHSVGEIAAAWASGWISAEQAISIATHRAEAISELAPEGAMAVVALEPQAVQLMVDSAVEGGLSIAAFNGPNSTVVSGPRLAIDRFVQMAGKNGVFARRLETVAYPGHSASMAAASARLASGISPSAPVRGQNWWSTVTGQLVTEADAEYWARNLLEPVQLKDAVVSANRSGASIFIEIAGAASLRGAIEETLSSTSPSEVFTFGEPNLPADLWRDRVRGRLFCAGLELASPPAGHGPMPPAEWSKRRYWRLPSDRPRRLTMLEPVDLPAATGLRIWKGKIDGSHMEWLGDHRVQGATPLPATGYLVLFDAAIRRASPELCTVISDVRFEKFLETSANSDVLLIDRAGELEIHARSGLEHDWARYSLARVDRGTDRIFGSRRWSRPKRLYEDCPQRVSASSLYRDLAERGLEYGENFRLCGDPAVGNAEAVVQILPPPMPLQDLAWDPRILDAALHLVATLAPVTGGPAVPARADVVVLYPPPTVGDLYAHVVRKDGPHLEFDVRLIDGEGLVYAQISGLRLVRVGASQVEFPKSVSLYETEWVRAEEAPRPSEVTALVVAADRESSFAIQVSDLLVRRGWSAEVCATRNAREAIADDRFRHVVVLATDAELGAAPAKALDKVVETLKSVAVILRGAEAALRGLHVWLATSRAGCPEAVAGTNPYAATFSGLTRALVLEHPGVRITHVDLEHPSDAEGLVQAIGGGDREAQVAVRAGELWTPRLRVVARRPQMARPRLRDSTYIVAGGLGGLGLAAADRLAERGVAHLMLLSRGAPETVHEVSLQKIRDRGTEVSAIQVDICNEAALKIALDSTTLRYPIRGVIHAAGTLRDGPFISMSEGDMREVLAAKVSGAMNLHHLTQAHPVERFVLFSSAASILGSPGQVAYAAANAALDGLAAHRRFLGLPALSINWGPWGEIGLAAREAQRQSLAHNAGATQLIKLLDSSDALDIFDALLGSEAPDDVCALPYDIRDIVQFFRGASDLRLLEKVTTRVGTPADDRRWLARPKLATPYEAPQTPLETSLVNILQRALEISSIGRNDPLIELGADSVVVGRVLVRIQSQYGIDVDPTEIYENPTAAALAQLVEAGLHRAIETMSDEEAEVLLARMEGADPPA